MTTPRGRERVSSGLRDSRQFKCLLHDIHGRTRVQREGGVREGVCFQDTHSPTAGLAEEQAMASVGSDPSSHDSGPLGYKGLREGLRETDRRGEETHHLSREAVFTFVWGFTTQFTKAVTKIALGLAFPHLS